MDLRPSRQTMTDALNAAGIEFPSSATLSQLRGLYEALMTQQSNHALKPASEEDTVEDMNQCAVQANTDAAENTIKTHVVANPAAQQQTRALDQYAVEVNTEVHVHDAAETEDNVTAVPKPAVIAAAARMHTGKTYDFLPDTASATGSDEIKKLQLRLQVLQLQQQIQALEEGLSYQSPVRRMDWMELDAAVPIFSGDDNQDINRWFVVFEDYAGMFSEKEKCAAIRRRLEGTAKQYVTNLGLLQFDDLKARLTRMFKRTVSRQEVYRQLQQRNLKPDESCLSYVVAMQSIAAKADIEEQELVDIIIDGVPKNDNAVNMLYGASSMDDLLRRLDRYECRRQQRRVPLKTVTAAKPMPSETTGNKSTEAEVRCYNCSQFGHYQSQCQKPRRPPNSCFVCAEMGHFHKDCPKKKTAVGAINIKGIDAFQSPN
ncbi:uncharacterized protein LOC119613515 [Lucilia sericata]|uniref:uncharacterized protein LOC119613515 n=1 Tax=Lucilia sericata TaxID=13632 RepID=UPI0018A829F1|nr:uncharacterized protein LOC119613515 [Lucilia sericata]